MANSVDPDQTAPVWVCIVCPDLFVPIFRILWAIRYIFLIDLMLFVALCREHAEPTMTQFRKLSLVSNFMILLKKFTDLTTIEGTSCDSSVCLSAGLPI